MFVDEEFDGYYYGSWLLQRASQKERKEKVEEDKKVKNIGRNGWDVLQATFC